MFSAPRGLNGGRQFSSSLLQMRVREPRKAWNRKTRSELRVFEKLESAPRGVEPEAENAENTSEKAISDQLGEDECADILKIQLQDLF